MIKKSYLFPIIKEAIDLGIAYPDIEICVFIVYQVLHMDKNDYYGGESTSLNLIQARKQKYNFKFYIYFDILLRYIYLCRF